MSDRFSGQGDITSGHPTTRNLASAPAPAPSATLPVSATYPIEARQPTDSVAYGPDIPTEAQFRLLGNLEGKRVLQLGCGSGAEAIAMARQGARVISVDSSLRRIETARANADAAEVKIELHQSDLAELPFLRADSLDLAISVYALANVDDLDRVFRQVHRVLHTECHFVFSMPHPAYAMFDPDAGDPPTVTRSYFSRSGRPWATEHDQGNDLPRTIGELFTSLARTNFRVDTILEPEPAGKRSAYWQDAMSWAPATLVIRATKEGI
ncbi:MAG TPA: class I SAM-dependent methyltransferase [Acidimicrobiales bacterium]